MSSLKEILFRMVAERSLSPAQAASLVTRLSREGVLSASTGPTASGGPIDVAVIGLSCRVPGAENPDRFWELLARGESAVTEVPPERWSVERLYDPEGTRPDGTTCKWGAFLGEIDRFDPLFFNISPKEADRMDPQQRLFLEESWKAMEDAGYSDRMLDGGRCGVFVGTGSGDYIHRMRDAGAAIDAYAFMGNSPSILSARISYFLNLKGPCIAMDTACSSSLVAIHLACESIAAGACDMALAGGVCVLMTPNFYIAASRSGMLSRTGQCRPFDDAADGFIPGEAVGVLVLKSLAAALRDGDRIHGVIKGSGINQDGRTNGITAPNAEAQAALETEVYTRHHLSPDTIGYVESHGTGTRLGDPIEFEALCSSFRKFTARTRFCALGSVKSTIGHTMTASGVVSTLKVLLALKHRQIPASVHFTRPNGSIRLDDSPFYFPTVLKDWESPDSGPRRAAVSSFGFSGTNAHLVIEEPPMRPPSRAKGCRETPYLFAVSARSNATLSQRCVQLSSWLQIQADANLGDVSYTLAMRRSHLDRRVVFAALDRSELIAQIDRYVVSPTARAEDSIDLCSTISDDARALAKRYLARQEVDWRTVCNGEERSIVSLPPYPFERRVHGVERQAGVGRFVSPRSSIHPFLDEVTPSLGSALFLTHFSRSDEILSDHVVHGNAILPGVAYLEMARAAAETLKREGPVSRFSKVEWLSPLIVSDAGMDVSTRLTEQGDTLLYEIESGPANNRVVHGRGEIGFDTTRSTKSPCQNLLRREAERDEGSLGSIDLQSIADRCNARVDPSELYARFESSGVRCGPFCRGLLDMKFDAVGLEALGRIGLPVEFENAPDRYILHPTLLDAAFQVAMALLASTKPGDVDGILVPGGVGGVEIKGRLPRRGYALVRLLSPDGGRAAARFAVCLTDDRGRILVKFDDFVVRRLSRASARPSAGALTQDPGAELIQVSRDVLSFYRPAWRRTPLDVESTKSGSVPAERSGTTLILRHTDDLGLSDSLARFHRRSTTLSVWLADQASTEDERPAIDHRRPEDYRELLTRIGPVETIYFLGGLSGSGPIEGPILDLDLLERTQELGVMSLFRLVKALGAHQPNRPAKLTVITRNVQRVLTIDPILPLSGSLIGLAKSISREFPHLAVTTVDIDGNDTRAHPETVARALGLEPGGPPGSEIAYRRAHRYSRILEPVVLPPAPMEKLPFKERGVYLVIGGAGGIGLELSRHLAAKVRARLVLVGRSELGPDRQEKVRRIEEAGGEVEYCQANVLDVESMRGVVDRVLRRWGRIDGAIHSAIVLRDRSIGLMDEATFRAALDPKVRASVVLSQVLSGQTLDFFAFFSSANALFGNAGQSNYAAACTFKDSFALHLGHSTGQRVRIFNWGYWGEIGIVATPEYNERLSRQGVGSISPAEGMDAFDRVLAGPLDQVMPIKVDGKVLKEMGVDLSTQVVCMEAAASSIIEDVVSATARTVDAEEQWQDLEGAAAAFEEVSQYGRDRLVQVFRRSKALSPDKPFTVSSLRASLNVVPKYERLLLALVDVLEREQLFEQDGELFVATARFRGPELALRLDGLASTSERLRHQYPEMSPFVELLDSCFDRYVEVLSGQVPANDVLFPGSSMDRVMRLYRGNRIADHYNRLFAECVSHAVETRARGSGSPSTVRLIEVGAGTGGTTAHVLDRLNARQLRVELLYTDLSPAFLRFGEKNFGSHGFVKFQVLDIEEDVLTQGLEPGSFDMVLASNVLHATRNLRRTLGHVKSLLHGGGLVVLNELTLRQDYATLTFGLTDGWWASEDGELRLAHSPLLGVPDWKTLLEEEGFTSVHTFGRPGTNPEALPQGIIVAESDGLVRRSASRSTVGSETDRSASRSASRSPVSSLVTSVQPVDLELRIQEMVGRAIGLPAREVDVDRRFSEYGVDSIIGVDLVKRINEELALSLKTTILFDCSSVSDLARFVAGELPQKTEGLDSQPPGPATAAEPPAASGQVTKSGSIDNLLDNLASGTISVEDALDRTNLIQQEKETGHGH